MSHLSFVIESSETSSLRELILKNGLSQKVSSESVKNVISHPPHEIWNVIRFQLDSSQLLWKIPKVDSWPHPGSLRLFWPFPPESHKIENRMWKENYKCGNFICLSCISFIFWGTQHVRKLTDSAEEHMVLTSHFSAGTCNIEYANLFNFSVRYGDPKAPWLRIFPSFETWSLRRTTAERDLMTFFFFFGKQRMLIFIFHFHYFFNSFAWTKIVSRCSVRTARETWDYHRHCRYQLQCAGCKLLMRHIITELWLYSCSIWLCTHIRHAFCGKHQSVLNIPQQPKKRKTTKSKLWVKNSFWHFLLLTMWNVHII